MYKNSNPLFMICETPLHAGSGSDLGIVDLPIQRERHTSFPKIEGSSMKGALRENMEQKALITEETDSEKAKTVKQEALRALNQAFGYDEGALRGFSKEEMSKLLPEENKRFAGCLGISDARLFLFPVKSMKGVFAWITCHKVLRQFEQDMRTMNGCEKLSVGVDDVLEGKCRISSDDIAISKGADKFVVLEEYTFQAETKDITIKEKDNGQSCTLGEWLVNNNIAPEGSYWEGKMKSSIVVLNDNAFKDFVNLSTEVITRNKINNITGTAADTGLFTEEYLPAESVLYSMILAAPEFKAGGKSADEITCYFKENCPERLQIGGSATLGKGIVRTQFLTQLSDKDCTKK